MEGRRSKTPEFRERMRLSQRMSPANEPELLMTGKLGQPASLMRWPSWRAWKCAPPTTASMAPDTSTRFRANVYGPGDHFELDRAHVIAALMRRFHDAKENPLAR